MRIKKSIKPQRIVICAFHIFFVIFWAFLVVLFSISIVNRKFIYPIKYYEYITKYSNEYGVDSALILATIKVESNFNKNAVSSKGAIGLMQIKEETASYIASMLGEEKFNLKDEETNVRYGTYYLKYLFEKFKSVQVVICAYNAGEGNVSLWLKDKTISKDGKTLEVVPFLETQNYLNKILKAHKKYIKLYPKILDKQNNIS